MANLIDSYLCFDELYCISDLHLGGESGFQMFTQGELLAGFFQSLAALEGEKRVILVINGDFIDFLAEARGQGIYLDPSGATTKLRRVFADPILKPALEALAIYLQTSSRFLALTLGNHDLELALPDVREELTRLLAGTDEAARGRLFLALDGAGFTAHVGRDGEFSARVLAVHGNEADLLNVTDHEALRRLCLDLSLGRTPKEWTPNAGTKLVIDLMNGIKERYPFVDLLKPEVHAVIPTLVALDPQLLSQVRKLWGVVGRAVGTGFRRAIGLLGADKPSPDGTAPGLRAAPRAGSSLRSLSKAGNAAQVDELLAVADQYLASDLDPVELAGGGELELLGPWGLALDLFHGRDPQENLRESLERWLRSEPSGSLTQHDDVYREVGLEAGADIHVVLTGHTHKPRALPRKKGLYFNSGAWADRIELSPTDLTKGRFEEVFNAFQSNRRQALDDARLIRREPLVVRVAPENGTIVGQLYKVEKEQGNVTLRTLEGSRLEVKRS